jgi:hypothetical protein
MTYRVIHRNDGKLTIDDICQLCRPDNLPTKPNHEKKFIDNLTFWMDDSHQLWKENSESRLELARKCKNGNPQEVADLVMDAILAPNIQHIFNNDSHSTEHLFRTLGLLLAVDDFTPHSGKTMGNSELASQFSKYLPAHIPNSNEIKQVLTYGHFLGFLEMMPDGQYVVDPTRAVRRVLKRVFEGQSILAAEDFFGRLAQHVPLLDRGLFRQQVEDKMSETRASETSGRIASKALSVSLERLRRSLELSFDSHSDDPRSYVLQLADDAREQISMVRLQGTGNRT